MKSLIYKISYYKMDKQSELLEEYTKTLSDKEILALNKAKEILGDSFDLKKSLGFLQWNKSKK